MTTQSTTHFTGEFFNEDLFTPLDDAVVGYIDGPAPELNIPLPLMLLAACFGIG
jgi:hypothetical protein